MIRGDSIVVQPEDWYHATQRKNATFLRWDGEAAIVKLVSGQEKKYPADWIFRAKDVRQAVLYENSRVPEWLGVEGATAVTLGRFVFVRGFLHPELLRHELIHVKQWRETLYVGFALVYAAQFLWGLLKTRSIHKAYRNISLEREAKEHSNHRGYLWHRRAYTWLRK